MLDAHPAPAAPARSPAAVPVSPIAEPSAPQPEPRSAPAALLAAARTLLPVLEAGRSLDARTLREAMTRAFGASDADGAWVWKDAYEAAEAALVLFLQRYGRAMRREAGAGPGGTAAMLRMLETVEHPTPLVQSGAMAAVSHPMPSYRPMLPERVVNEGQLSDAQLESVVLAGQAHERHLAAEYRIGAGWETVQRVEAGDDDDAPACEDDSETVDADEPLSDPVRFRRGWMLGDGTGCGKGRQVSAIVLDQWLRGRKRALWLSQSDKLLEDTRRDWCAVGGHEEDVIPLGKVRQGAEIPHGQGILFATYATLRSPARQGKPSRLDQIVAWLADGDDEDERHAYQGVIVFDEAHAMANAAGSKGARGEVRPSQQGRAGLRLQNALPDARILYVSATGATTVPGLAYARRLGLWASGETPFETRTAFVAAMEAGGVAAMEVVARDLKALGLYQARALSYDGVEVDILEHPLTPEQRRIYDSYAGAFKIIHANIQEALKATGIVDGDSTLNKNAKSAALSAFEGAKQRFFGHLLTSMKCPSLIRAIKADLEAGRSAVVQLVSTGEALMERRIAEIPASEWDDLSIDLTPREYVLDFLEHAFPVQLQEPFEDDDGNLMSRPVFDADNNPVLCQEALANLKEDLPPMPQFLNRLLALPIDEQNQLFGALETRIEANIEIAIEAGTFERGVETIAADSLSVAQRETVFVHEGSGAETEIVEIARREPVGVDQAEVAAGSERADAEQHRELRRRRRLPDQGGGDRGHRDHQQRQPGDDGGRALGPRQGLGDQLGDGDEHRRQQDHHRAEADLLETRPQDRQHAGDAETEPEPAMAAHWLAQEQDRPDRGDQRARQRKRGGFGERDQAEAEKPEQHRAPVEDPAHRVERKPPRREGAASDAHQPGDQDAEPEDIAEEGDLERVEIGGEEPHHAVHRGQQQARQQHQRQGGEGRAGIGPGRDIGGERPQRPQSTKPARWVLIPSLATRPGRR